MSESDDTIWLDEPEVTSGEWVKLPAIVPGDFWQVWETVTDLMRKHEIDHPNERVRNGLIIEVLCAEWLAGH